MMSHSTRRATVDPAFWQGKRVLVTGHTGFKGSWLSWWLLRLGAEVYGFALPPDTKPSLFQQLDLPSRMHHLVGDVRDATAVRDRVRSVSPDIVFHLAAQALVRRSYGEPVATWETNVCGTMYLLDALRSIHATCGVVIVTSDKVYENREEARPFVESDRLGGHDPYSSSKAACELVVESWRRSFFSDATVRIASARAGNVIGGGDWAADRIVPDLARALVSGAPVRVRRPTSIRPWQHVLDPLAGYMILAERLLQQPGSEYSSAWNFGPRSEDTRTVAELIAAALAVWPGPMEIEPDRGPHEAAILALDSWKATSVLGWHPTWRFDEAVLATVDWYKRWNSGCCPRECTDSHIDAFSEASFAAKNQ